MRKNIINFLTSHDKNINNKTHISAFMARSIFRNRNLRENNFLWGNSGNQTRYFSHKTTHKFPPLL